MRVVNSELNPETIDKYRQVSIASSMDLPLMILVQIQFFTTQVTAVD